MSKPTTAAYVNWGRIVGDCGLAGCDDAVLLQPGQQAMQCVSGHVSDVQWDKGIPAVMSVLAERPEERRRNWFPKGHPLALATGQPHGQSIQELREEHRREVAAGDERRNQLAEVLAGFGLALGADGQLKGDL